MSKYLLVGGKQRDDVANHSEEFRYEEALVLEVDMESGKVEKKISYKTPLEYKADEDSSVVFKASHIDNEKKLLYLCTQTEVLIYTLPDFTLKHHITHPHFNDIHHVVPNKRGNLYVVSTGLDLLIEITMEGEALQYWDALGRKLWTRHNPDTDYRKVASTKPHDSHPNFVFTVNDEIWLTRFEQKDAINITTGKTIDIQIEKPHDGHLAYGKLYFTTVNGYIVIAEPISCKIIKTINLNKLYKSLKINLGWCRGLHIENDETVIVAFSKMRKTKYSNNVNWIRALKKNTSRLISGKTRITKLNIKKEIVLDEIIVEDFHMNSIFSILPNRQ